MKILLIFGLGIGLNICLSFIMLAITSQLRKTFIDRWIFNFILMFVQDFLIMPYIHLLIAKGKVTLLKWKKIKGFPKLRSFIWNSMDQFIARFLYNFDITSSRKKIKKRVVVEKVQQEFSFEDPNPNNRFSRPKLRRTMNQNS